MKNIIIVGAGLAGSYMAYAMGKKGTAFRYLRKDLTLVNPITDPEGLLTLL